VTAPELPENVDVELIVMLPEPEEIETAPVTAPRVFRSALEYPDSLPAVHRTPEE
jgi:hypothetical protein